MGIIFSFFSSFCLGQSQKKKLRHPFFGSRSLRKTGLLDDVSKDLEAGLKEQPQKDSLATGKTK